MVATAPTVEAHEVHREATHILRAEEVGYSLGVPGGPGEGPLEVSLPEDTPSEQLNSIAAAFRKLDFVTGIERPPFEACRFDPYGDSVLPAPDPDPALSCGSEDFPLSVFDEPANAERQKGDAEAVLRSVTTKTGWRVVVRTPTKVVFARGLPPRLALRGIEEIEPGVWKKTGMGPCRTLITRDGLRPGNWVLDPSEPAPDVDSTVLHVLVEDVGCHGHEPVVPRLQEADIRYAGGGVVTIALYFTPSPGQAHTCPGTPAEPTTIELPEPLRGRVLRDGGKYPASVPGVNFPPAKLLEFAS